MINLDLDGRVALVTGGGRGIGRACVETLADAGARVVFGYVDPDRSEEVEAWTEQLRRLDREVIPYRGDLTQREECQRIVEVAEREFGSLHILVSNAGRWRRSGIDLMSDEDLTSTVDLNLKAVFRLNHFAVRLMQKQPGVGSIIHIASTAGERGEAHYSHYAATKGALVAMCKSLACELAPKLRVNCISPGWVETEMTREVLEGPERRRIESEIPLGRVGAPEDVANAVAFLASDRASWITGSVIRINGGAVLGE